MASRQIFPRVATKEKRDLVSAWWPVENLWMPDFSLWEEVAVTKGSASSRVQPRYEDSDVWVTCDTRSPTHTHPRPNASSHEWRES